MAQLLAALAREAREDYEALRPQLRRVRLEPQQVISWPGEPITRIYFPITAVLSVLVPMDDATEVEAGIIGREGLFGLPVFLGATSTSHRAMVQVGGEAWRLPVDAFREALDRSAALRDLVGRYAQTFFVQLAQAVGCNRVHSMQQRCARWLLMVHDRVGDDRFALTQERLAEKLGVRRATVSRVMVDLQRRGLLRYTRGIITVMDRPGLEVVSCVCYRLIQAEADRLLGRPDSAARAVPDSDAEAE